MTLKLNRIKILIILLSIALFFVFLNRINFIIGSETATGEVIWIKRWNTSPVGRSGGSYSAPVVKFNVNNLDITFQAETNLDYEKGDKVSVIYKKANPEIAEIYTFNGFWLGSFLWSLLPILIITAAVLSFFNKTDIVLLKFGKKVGISKLKIDKGKAID